MSERGSTPSVAQNSRTHAETQVSQTSSGTIQKGSNLGTAGYVSPLANNIPPNTYVSTTAQPGQTDNSLGLEPKDEAAIIEERRKRREAIRAKYRSQPTPLLVQALEQKGSEPVSAATTPTTSKAITPESGQSTNQLIVRLAADKNLDARPVSPQTPNLSDPQSPADFDFSKEENLANRDSHVSTGADEEPSAADYDPTADMREERARHDQSLFHEDKQSLANDTARVSGTENNDTRQTRKSKDEFDMFADDDQMEDDGDMFAPASSKKPSANGESKGRAQALDVTMMDNWDDPEGYYITIRDELFADRYVVMHTLGRGMFSSVIRAKDTQTGQLVAIKITRNNDTMRKAGFKEISILETLGAADPTDTKHMIRLLTSFEHKGHLCLVFENLSLNLRELLKKFGRDVGLNIKAIRSYAQQLFLGLSLLRKCGIIHADLKPDNVLCSDNHAHIKICDLGSAAPVTDNEIAPYLVSRFYRAPEIMLGIDYDTGIDVWSIGCTLFELYTGKILFTGRNNNGMLKAIMECRGPFPNKLLRRGRMTFDHFDDMLNFYSREEDKLSGRVFTKQMTFKKATRDLRSRVIPKGKKMVDEGERRDVELFLDLLDKCLDLRPEKRISPSDALRHPFIMRGTVAVGEKGR